MSDCERRLQRLEEQARPATEGRYVTRETIEKRNAELFTPEELLAIDAEIAADPEGHRAEMAAIKALLADLAAANCKRANAETRRLTATSENDS